MVANSRHSTAAVVRKNQKKIYSEESKTLCHGQLVAEEAKASSIYMFKYLHTTTWRMGPGQSHPRNCSCPKKVGRSWCVVGLPNTLLITVTLLV